MTLTQLKGSRRPETEHRTITSHPLSVLEDFKMRHPILFVLGTIIAPCVAEVFTLSLGDIAQYSASLVRSLCARRDVCIH